MKRTLTGALAALCLLAAPLSARAGARSGVDGTVDVTAVNAAGQVGTAQNGQVVQTTASVPINVATATTVELVGKVTGQQIYVTAWDVEVAGADTVTLVIGAGTNCATGQTPLTGPYTLATSGAVNKGSGLGPVIVVPLGKALCITTSAAVQASGSVSYAQF